MVRNFSTETLKTRQKWSKILSENYFQLKNCTQSNKDEGIRRFSSTQYFLPQIYLHVPFLRKPLVGDHQNKGMRA